MSSAFKLKDRVEYFRPNGTRGVGRIADVAPDSIMIRPETFSMTPLPVECVSPAKIIRLLQED